MEDGNNLRTEEINKANRKKNVLRIWEGVSWAENLDFLDNLPLHREGREEDNKRVKDTV